MTGLFICRVEEYLASSHCDLPFRFCCKLHEKKVEIIPLRTIQPVARVKGAVYTVWTFICICMSLRVFLFAKKMEFLTKGGIHCISQVFPWHFYFMREHSLVELTEHDDSAANINVHSIHIYVLKRKI